MNIKRKWRNTIQQPALFIDLKGQAAFIIFLIAAILIHYKSLYKSSLHIASTQMQAALLK